MLQYNDTQVYIKPVAILLAIYFLFLIKMSAVTQYSISGTTCITRQSALEKCFNTVKYVIVREYICQCLWMTIIFVDFLEQKSFNIQFFFILVTSKSSFLRENHKNKWFPAWTIVWSWSESCFYKLSCDLKTFISVSVVHSNNNHLPSVPHYKLGSGGADRNP